MTTSVERRISHPYFMHDAIMSEPDAIARILNQESDAASKLAEMLEVSSRVHVVGIGTSWHAALVGEFLLRVVGGCANARAWNSFEFCAYPPPLDADDAVIILSHRGTKRYSLDSLKMANEAGAAVGLFTAIGSAGRTDLASVVIRTSPEEKSAAFTVSHVTAMTALAMLTAEVGARAGRAEAVELKKALMSLPSLVKKAIDREPAIRQWAKDSQAMKQFFFTGWGPNASTAYEVALKLKEACYVFTEGFQLEQYLHGPFVATSKDCMTTVIAPPGAGRERAFDVLRAAREVGARTAAIAPADDSEAQSLVDDFIAMPAMPEALTPIVYLVPFQLFTYWLSVESNCNPDVFRLNDPSHRAARQQYQL